MRRLDLPVAEIAARYADGESIPELARAFRVTRWPIRRRLRSAGVKMRQRGGPPGNTKASKPGGPLCDNGRGYLATMDRGGKNCLVHRGCWEAHHGAIPDGMHVHHINEDRADPRIENLIMVSPAEHSALHACLQEK